MKMKYLLLFMPICINAQTKNIEVSPSIKEAIVYPSSAELNYEKKIHLVKGKNSIVFTDLPLYIVENSVNVALSDPTSNIITVTEKFNYVKEKKSNSHLVSSFQDSILKIEKQIGLLGVKKESLEAEKELLFRGSTIGGIEEGVSVAEIEKASVFFSKRHYQLNKEIYDIKELEFDLSSRKYKFENQVKQSSTVVQHTTSEIIVLVNVSAEREVVFNLKFLTAKAGWAPQYDFKYDGPKEPLDFIFRANVFNASGANWEDVKIKLSTADPIKGFALPEADTDNKKIENIDGVKFKQVEVINAITEYKIKHEYNIPSDSKPYLLEVTDFKIPASFNYLLIPKLDPFGFLMAKIPNWNKYNLIPGVTNIYNSGTYMGKTFLNTYADNDTLSLFLGKDKRIQATRNESSIVNSRYLIGNFETEETKVELSVKNNSEDILSVEVLDQVPVAEDKDEKLSISGIGKAFYEKDEGKITWKQSIKPNETIKLDYKYELKYPKNPGDGFYAKKRKFRTIACPSF